MNTKELEIPDFSSYNKTIGAPIVLDTQLPADFLNIIGLLLLKNINGKSYLHEVDASGNLIEVPVKGYSDIPQGTPVDFDVPNLWSSGYSTSTRIIINKEFLIDFKNRIHIRNNTYTTFNRDLDLIICPTKAYLNQLGSIIEMSITTSLFDVSAFISLRDLCTNLEGLGTQIITTTARLKNEILGVGSYTTNISQEFDLTGSRLLSMFSTITERVSSAIGEIFDVLYTTETYEDYSGFKVDDSSGIFGVSTSTEKPTLNNHVSSLIASYINVKRLDEPDKDNIYVSFHEALLSDSGESSHNQNFGTQLIVSNSDSTNKVVISGYNYKPLNGNYLTSVIDGEVTLYK